MNRQHEYTIETLWTGNTGTGTTSYTAYERSHTIQAAGKIAIECSSDPGFRGDSSKYNPEELFVASISSCHMLWYLHLCADNKITVESYSDAATGIMHESSTGGSFTEVSLHPRVSIKETDKKELALELHHKAHSFCYIASSCNFPILCYPEIL